MLYFYHNYDTMINIIVVRGTGIPNYSNAMESISMCIYKSKRNYKKYRKIYENHYGPVPKEQNGRSYDIHHVDGDYTNNDPKNLIAITIQEHYDIHYSLGDFGACYKMAPRLRLSSEERSFLCSLAQKKRVEDGTHNLLGPDTNQKRIDEGTHQFLDSEWQRERALKRIENGTSRLSDPSWQKEKAQKSVNKGTHNFLQKVTCPHCGKTGGLGPMKRYHFDKCKIKPLIEN